ncbi:MAG: hypothetical protein RIM99_18675 [Cyclobacteriaceae bacterium]
MPHFKNLNISWLLGLFALFVSCGGGENGAIIPVEITAKSVSVNDFQNNGNSSDIRVSFTKPADLSFVSTFRILIAKAASADNLDVDVANAVPDDAYYEIQSNASSGNIALPANLNDTDGDAIIEAENYRAYILSKGIDADDALSTGSSNFQLAQINLVTTLVPTVAGGSGGMAIDTEGNIYMADFGQTLGGPPGDKFLR